MAPTHVHRLVSRSVNSGLTFTITFIVVAAVAIMVCVVWALWPHISNRFFVPRISQTRYNQPPRPRQGFSVDRADRVFRNIHRPRGHPGGSSIAMYDPRTQTPFPDRPRNDSSQSTLNVHTSHILSPYRPPATQNSGLFTPTQHRAVLSPNVGSGSDETSKKHTRSSRTKTPVVSKDFGDAKDYILTLPEPLCISRKPVQKNLILSTTAPKLGGTKLPSTASEKLLHPNKLFEQIGERDVPNSDRSSTSPTIEAASGADQTGATLGSGHHDEAGKSLPPVKGESSLSALEDTPRPITPMSSDSGDSESCPHNASIAAMHRLKTYRSLVGAPPPAPLQRAGTLTRPKTPVSKIRDLYDRAASESKAQPMVSRNDTSSTRVGTAQDSSDGRSSSTSATSPPKTAPSKFHASSVSLLPVPLRVVRSDSRSISTLVPSKASSGFKQIRKPDFTESETRAAHNTVVRHVLHRPRQGGTPTSISSVTKPRPAPLTFASNIHFPARPENSCVQVNSQDEGSSNLTNEQAVPSSRASSIYSRNTKGFSIARTNSFQSPFDAQPPFSPSFQSTIRDESEAGTETNLLRKSEVRQINTAAKSKVEDWDVQMADGLNFEFSINTSPSSSLKRALSSLGSGQENHHLQLNATPPMSAASALLTNKIDQAHNRQSTISTEIAPSELALSTVDMPTLRISGFSNQFGSFRHSAMTDSSQGDVLTIPTRLSTLRSPWSDPSLSTLTVRDKNKHTLHHRDEPNWI